MSPVQNIIARFVPAPNNHITGNIEEFFVEIQTELAGSGVVYGSIHWLCLLVMDC